MHSVYLVAFVVGVLLIAVFFLLGELDLGGPTHGHVHDGSHDLSGSGGHAALGLALTLLSPLIWAGALLLFGGVGLIFGGSTLALPLALAAGVVGLVGLRLLMSALRRSDTAPLALGAEGAVGKVNARIAPLQTGEVVYTLEGLARSMPARSEIGTLDRGTEVVITHVKDGFAWVEPVYPLAGGEKE